MQESAKDPGRHSSGELPRPADEMQRQHSRASSTSSTLTAGTLDMDRVGISSLPIDLGDFSQVISSIS
jgi:hypothetical protein